MSKIVVGVDGSAEARRALEWAAGEAQLRQLPLEVVYAYEYTPAWQLYGYEGVSAAQMDAIAAEDEEAERQAAEQAQGLLDSMVLEVGDVGVEVTSLAVTDRRPAAALVARCTDAEMLVVGSRGRGGFSGLLLGSVSQQVATHATCPVVIISQRAAGEADDA